MKKTKILAFLLVTVLLLSSIPAITVSAADAETVTDLPHTLDVNVNGDLKDDGTPNGGSNYLNASESSEEDDIPGISTYGEFAYAIQNYGTDKVPAGTVIELSSDIDCGNKRFNNTIFGNLVDGMVIDGNGHSIYNFSIYNWRGRGLFDVANGAHFTIKNLDFGTPDSYISAQWETGTAWDGFGIIIGQGVYNAEQKFSFDISNVDVYTNANYTKNKTFACGALIGDATLTGDSSITNCNVYGTITAAKTANFRVAGFVGDLKCDKTLSTKPTLTFTNCSNNIVLTGGSNCGGFVGISENGANYKFDNCVNNGDIDATYHIGGFIGYSSSVDGVFTNCVNMGSIKGTDCLAGFVGKSATKTNSLTLTNCINAGSLTDSVEADDANSSHVTRNDDSNGINVVLTNVYALSTATTTANLYAFEAVNTTEITSLELLAAKMREFKMGYYEVIDGKVAINTLVPQFVGYQETAVDYVTEENTTTGSFDSRFVAVLKDGELNNFSEVGFVVSAVCSDGTGFTDEKLSSTTVFKSLNASVDGAMKSYDAYELDGKYIIAIAWEGVPASVKVGDADATNLTVTFTVTPYAISADGETTYTGLSYDVTYVGGIAQ